MAEEPSLAWRGPVTDDEMVELVRSQLGTFYFDACGFRPTSAGLIRLRS